MYPFSRSNFGSDFGSSATLVFVVASLATSSFRGMDEMLAALDVLQSDSDFDAPAAAPVAVEPTHHRRSRRLKTFASDATTLACAFIAVSGLLSLPPGPIMDAWASSPRSPPLLSCETCGIIGIVFYTWHLRKKDDPVTDDYSLELQEREMKKTSSSQCPVFLGVSTRICLLFQDAMDIAPRRLKGIRKERGPMESSHQRKLEFLIR